MNNDEMITLNFAKRVYCNVVARTTGLTIWNELTGIAFAEVTYDKNNGEPGYPFTVSLRGVPQYYAPTITDAVTHAISLERFA